MQKRSSWSASIAKAFFVFSFVTHCVSAVAIAGTGTAVSAGTIPPFPTATGYGTGNIPPFPTATGYGTGNIPPFPIPTGYGTGSSNALSSSTQLLLSTGGTIPSPSQSSSTSSLYSVTFGTPSIAPVTIIQSGTTGTVPVINGGSYPSPITLPPIVTTIASSQATSSVSSVSSEVAGLIPIIKSWKANPSSLKSNTLDKIGPVKSDVEGLISDLGGGLSSSACGSKRKRGLLGAIGDIVHGLSCIAGDLGSITDHINANDIDAIDDPLNDLTLENDDLTNDNNDDNDNKSDSNSNSDSSTSTSKSSSSSSLCISSKTALQVTVQCVPTSFSTGGSIISTTTCSPLSTVTASGCFVTGLTTTVSTSTSASMTQVPCASDTCGNACPMNGGGPLSGASMSMMASTENCASISTITTSALPTASYGLIGSIAVASPTPESIAGGPSKRSFSKDPMDYDRTLVDRSLDERALPNVTPPYANYVQNLNVRWINQNGDASAQWFDYPNYWAAAGVNGIYGCTSVFIVSQKGVYISHIWENPVFVINNDYVPTDDNTFTTKTFYALRDGTATAVSILALVGTAQAPGPLNAIYNPKVFVVTPFTSPEDRSKRGITTTYTYQARAQQLARQIVSIVPGSGDSGFVRGYSRTNEEESTEEHGIAGRAILEVDPLQSLLTSPHAPPNHAGLAIGRWRLWIEDQLVTYQDFWKPDYPHRKRDVGNANPCASLASSSSTTATSSGTSTPSLALVTPSATSTDTYIQPSSCVYTVTTELGVTVTSAYTIQPTVATMCICDSTMMVGINTVTGKSSTSYLVCELSSSITVSTLQPPPPTPPPPPPPTPTPPPPPPPPPSPPPKPLPNMKAKPCIDCTNDMGASNCAASDNQCLVNQCNTDKSCQACGIDCNSFVST